MILSFLGCTFHIITSKIFIKKNFQIAKTYAIFSTNENHFVIVLAHGLYIYQKLIFAILTFD